ncbi:MAG TPA: HAD family phosphatase [Streptosporangiaceae bacterium]|nr:HAD family phosphatase [Streptosporangiaceae bacterium]
MSRNHDIPGSTGAVRADGGPGRPAGGGEAGFAPGPDGKVASVANQQEALSAAAEAGIRGVIIDWGGVLTNSIRETVAAWAEAEGVDWKSYVAVMRPWLEDSYHADAVGNPVHALERGECAVEEFEEMFAARLVRVDGGPVSGDGLLARMFGASLTVPAMYDMLRALRAAGFRTCLLSNSWGPGGYQRDDFPELFDAVVISSEVGMRKPERRIFLHAAGLLGLEPRECVFVDDIEANVTAAVACGMAGVRHEDPKLTAERLTALLGVTLGK